MEQRRAAGLLEDLLGEREKLDGILNTNDRFCFKLNENKLSEEYIEVTMRAASGKIHFYLSMYKGGGKRN